MKSPEAIGAAVLKRLLAQAAANRASGARLRAEVRAVWEQHPEFTAKQVIKYLSPPFQWVSVRRAQEVLKELRAESAMGR
jgi:hypothetical protein